MKNEELGKFLTEKLESKATDAGMSNGESKIHSDACALLLDATAVKDASSAHLSGRVNDAVAKFLGNCALDLLSPSDSSKDEQNRFVQAREMASHVQGIAASGQIDEGFAFGQLEQAYGMASGLGLEAQAAQGHIGAAMGEVRGRLAARKASAGSGLNESWVAANFRSADELFAYQNTKKVTAA